MSLNTDEFDTAFAAALDEKPEEPSAQAPAAVQAGSSAPAAGAAPPPGGAPPPKPPPPSPVRRRATVRPTVDPNKYQGRKPFPDLFTSDTTAPAPRGGVEEKIEYFREKLRVMEQQALRFKGAWEQREAELDAVELLVEREREKGAALEKRVATLETFIGQKRTEVEAFQQQVKEAMAERDIRAHGLSDDLQQARQAQQQAEAALASRDEAIRRLSDGVKELKEQLAKQQQELEAKDKALAEQQWRIASLEREVAAGGGGDSAEVERLKMALRAERAKVKQLGGE